ncbi:MAG: metallophosphoesterase [Clostridia bacterium]|nr:metallophosphoesterase [Clostridia bacterium]
MKRVLSTTLVLFTIILLIFGAVMFFTITNFTSYNTSLTVDEDNRLLSSDGESITILQLTDVQTANLIECAMAYPSVKRMVDKCKPDMIVLTGDNISDNSDTMVLSAFISLMDSFELPWALVFGNHDRNSAVSMEDICSSIEASRYSLFKTGYLDDRYGNYYYNIELQGETVRTLIFMDSAKSNFTEEQVEWYENTVSSISKREGEVIPSFVFFHIPIQQTEAAHQIYAENSSVGSGIQADKVDVQDEDTGFFDTAKTLGSTDALFYGHDHRNNTFIEYEDILFCYGRKTGTTVYFEPGMTGANLITVTADDFTVERVDWK